MSDEPKIQRFRVRPTGKHSWEKEFCEDGGNVSFLDVEPYVAAQVEQARREIREREVRPLMDAARLLAQTINAHGIVSLSCDRDGEVYCECVEQQAKAVFQALAAVAKAQEERP